MLLACRPFRAREIATDKQRDLLDGRRNAQNRGYLTSIPAILHESSEDQTPQYPRLHITSDKSLLSKIETMEEWKWVNSEVGHQLFSPSTQDSEDIDVAAGSMPIEWNERGNFLEWKNPWYSHGPETSDSRSGEQVFCSESAPKTTPTPSSSSASSEAASEPCGRQHRPQPALRCDGTRCGQAWTVALCAVWGCRDTHGLEAALSLMREVCLGLMPAELAEAFCDFESAIKQKRAISTQMFTPSG